MNKNGKRVLVVEDDPEMRVFLKTCLESEGMVPIMAASGHDALERARQPRPDLAILDLGLPDTDGVALLAALRAAGPVPVIVLTARVDEREKVRALDAGADDYLTKPFGVGELLARIRVAFRHAGHPGTASPPPYELEGLKIDVERHRVFRNGEEIHLTPTEFKLLARLARNSGQVVTHRQLLTEVWGAEFVEHTHYLRVYMGQLRAKIERDGADPRFLLTETGVGYRLADT